MRRLLVLGSTGSVGCNTLDVVARHRDRIEIVALAAQRDDQTLFEHDHKTLLQYHVQEKVHYRKKIVLMCHFQY